MKLTITASQQNHVELSAFTESGTVQLTPVAREAVIADVALWPVSTGGGDSNQIVCNARTTIHSLRVVASDASGRAYHPNVHDLQDATRVVGLAVQSAAQGSSFRARYGGQMFEVSWGWQPGPVWCGDQGRLTQSPPASGWLLQVGRATSPNTLIIDIEEPIVRSFADLVTLLFDAPEFFSLSADTFFAYQFEATGAEPITYTVTEGELPPGLTLSPTGLLSGTPT
jgi:hypothetical protein